MEIQRLIGRSLRAVVDMEALESEASSSTATCCRPTAAPTRHPSPVRFTLALAVKQLRQYGGIAATR
jgi:hypothetical protein